MSDSSSEDELGFFAFHNKKKIVSTPPEIQPKELEPSEPVVVDKALFRKRKRASRPIFEGGDSLDDSFTLLEYREIDEEFVEAKPTVPTETVSIELLEDPVNILEPVIKTRKFQKCANDSAKLASNIDNMLNLFKLKQGVYRADIPQEDVPVPQVEEEDKEARAFILKLRKGSNIHRFKIKMDTPLSVVLSHLAVSYNTEPSYILLQLNDVQLDSNSTPEKLGIGITDFVEVLINARPQSVAEVKTMMIKIQSKEQRNNCRQYHVIKTKPLREYFFKATQDFGYKAARFRFDGEPVTVNKTPEELDMEEGDCMDIEPL